MTREVQIGEQVVKLRATGSLPLAYRALFNRDLLQDMDKWRDKLRVEMEQADAEAASENAETDPAAGETSGQTDLAGETPSDSGNQILYSMDLALVARLAYAMAKSADPSVPSGMTEWLDTLESPNALYILTGEVLQLYNSGFETTVEAKKNIPPRLAP